MRGVLTVKVIARAMILFMRLIKTDEACMVKVLVSDGYFLSETRQGHG